MRRGRQQQRRADQQRECRMLGIGCLVLVAFFVLTYVAGVVLQALGVVLTKRELI